MSWQQEQHCSQAQPYDDHRKQDTLMQTADVRLMTARPRDIDPDGWTTLHRLIDAGERRKAAGLVHEEDRQAFVLARALRRCAVAAELSLASGSIRFAETAQGAPLLVDGPPDFHFSHSHCRRAVAVAVTRAAAVGVDVEHADTVTADDLGAFVSPQQRPAPGIAQPTATQQWTALEAFWKATGVGLSETNPRVAFRLEPGGNATVIFDQAMPAARGTASWVDAFDDCTLAVALCGPASAFSISRIHCKSALEIKQLCHEALTDNSYTNL